MTLLYLSSLIIATQPYSKIKGLTIDLMVKQASEIEIIDGQADLSRLQAVGVTIEISKEEILREIIGMTTDRKEETLSLDKEIKAKKINGEIKAGNKKAEAGTTFLIFEY